MGAGYTSAHRLVEKQITINVIKTNFIYFIITPLLIPDFINDFIHEQLSVINIYIIKWETQNISSTGCARFLGIFGANITIIVFGIRYRLFCYTFQNRSSIIKCKESGIGKTTKSSYPHKIVIGSKFKVSEAIQASGAM